MHVHSLHASSNLPGMEIVEFHLRLQFYSIPFLVETPSLAFSTHSLLKVPNSRIVPTLTFQFQSPGPHIHFHLAIANALAIHTLKHLLETYTSPLYVLCYTIYPTWAVVVLSSSFTVKHALSQASGGPTCYE